MKKRRLSYEQKKGFYGLLFTLPYVIGSLYFFFVPFISSFLYSLSDVSISEGGMVLKFKGLQEYISAFTSNAEFIRILVYATQTMLWQVPLILIFSVFLAVILNGKYKGRILVRGIFFLPVIIASGIIINIMNADGVAKTMLEGGRSATLFQGINFGVLLISVGVPKMISEALMVVIKSIFQLVWKSGVQSVLLIAGLQSVPSDVYEAASIEGATPWEIFWKITLPMISPILVLVSFYTIIDTSTDYSNRMVRYFRDMASQLKLSFSSMISVVWFLVVLFITIIVFIALKNVIKNSEDN